MRNIIHQTFVLSSQIQFLLSVLLSLHLAAGTCLSVTLPSATDLEQQRTSTEFVMVVQLYMSKSWKTLACNKIVMQPHYQEIPHHFLLTILCKAYTDPIVITSHELQTSLTKSYSIDLFTTTHQQNWFWNCMTGERTVWGDWCKTMHKVVWPFVNYN